MLNTWTTKAVVPTLSTQAPAVAVGTKIYYFGQTITNVYDTSLNTWTTKAVMPTARPGAVAVAVGTDIYVL